MAISSTDCRDRVAEDQPVWYLVPDGVVQYIAKYGLYRRNAGGGATSDELLLATDDLALPTGISADGQRLLVTRGLGPRQRHIADRPRTEFGSG